MPRRLAGNGARWRSTPSGLMASRGSGFRRRSLRQTGAQWRVRRVVSRGLPLLASPRIEPGTIARTPTDVRSPMGCRNTRGPQCVLATGLASRSQRSVPGSLMKSQSRWLARFERACSGVTPVLYCASERGRVGALGAASRPRMSSEPSERRATSMQHCLDEMTRLRTSRASCHPLSV